MKRFHFRLERLLEIRAYKERQWLARLAAASGACIRLSRRIRENDQAAFGAFHTDIRKGRELDLALLSYREHYIKRLGLENKRLGRELQEGLRRRSEVQGRYAEVLREKKVIEKLKTRRQSEYYARARLEGFKAADEISSGRFAVKNR